MVSVDASRAGSTFFSIRHTPGSVKPFLAGVAALVVGIIVGAWQPRGELLSMREELDSLKASQAKCGRGGAAAGIRELLHAEARERRTENGSGPQPIANDRMKAAPDENSDGNIEIHLRDDPPAKPAGPENATEAAEMAGAALDARRAQARAALVEQGDLSDEQMAAVDAAMAEMNTQLKAEVDQFVDSALSAAETTGGEIDRREMMDLAAGSLDVVIAADDAVRKALPPDVYDAIDDQAVDPFSYISGDTLASLAKLDGMDMPDE